MNVTYTPDNPAHIDADWFVAQVSFRSNSGKPITRSQIIDNRTPEHPLQMVDDEIHVIALKCFFILIGLPFYTLGVMAVHTVRCFTLVGNNLINGEFSEAFLSLVQEIISLVKTPFYALAIEFYAFVGIFWPLPIRSAIAQLERDWSGSERRFSLMADKSENAIANYFSDRLSKTTIFLAYCFQPIRELNDPEKVIRYRITNPAL